MSTWHQDRNSIPLWHATKHTVVEDKLNQLLSVSRWDTAQEANEHAEKVQGYVIPPSSKEPI